MAGGDISYDVAGLRASATGQDDTAGLADALATALSSLVIVRADLGTVPAAAGFVSAAQALRAAQAAGARGEAHRRRDLAVRARGVADLGERLDTDTTAIARESSGNVPFGDGVDVLRGMQADGPR